MTMNEGTRLFLVRHGDTIDEETTRVYKGTIDLPLSEKGRDRIRRAASFMSRFPIDHVYTSELNRCIESGSIIADPHNLSIKTSRTLNEISFGAWEGRSFGEIAREYPEEFRAWHSDPEAHCAPGGETLRDAEQRVIPGFEEIVARHTGESVAVVAHGGILRIILCSILDLKLSLLFRLSQDYGGISIVDFYNDKNAVVKLLNFTFYP